MNKAAKLVSQLIETGPDDVNPKNEFMRLPDRVFEIKPEDFGGENDEEYRWKNDLAQQLNRLAALASELSQSGKHLEAQDLDSIISRVAEFESIPVASQ